MKPFCKTLDMIPAEKTILDIFNVSVKLCKKYL